MRRTMLTAGLAAIAVVAIGAASPTQARPEELAEKAARSFEHKPSAVETVTPMLDPDGIRRGSGYFIK